MKIKYVSKEKLFPAFGEVKGKIVYVRKDLPKIVRNFVKEHELYHLIDKSDFWIWREFKANLHGFMKYPFGFLLCGVMSLTPSRLKFYLDRFRKGK